MPLFRLPALFTRSVQAIPGHVPYLIAEPERVAYWQRRLAPLGGIKIGVAWQGNPEHTRDADRSFRLTDLEPLARIGGVTLIRLQKGFGSEQLGDPNLRFPVVDFGDEVDPGLHAMRDTPAIIQCLDLVVTPDTSLAHLAGALAAPVWIALPLAPDWRWLLDRADTPWYPTARLFRQSRRGEWRDVFEGMASALREQRP